MLKKTAQLIIAGVLALPGAAFAAGAVQLPATNQTKCFAENGSLRNCAGTGEDGEKMAGIAWPDPRFADKGNGTVNDKLTGLVWSKRANSPDINAIAPFVCANAENDMTWLQALDFIACLNANSYLGAKNWRLPNLNELESMVNSDIADTSAFLNSKGFVQVQPSQYWTSTSDASDLPVPSAASAWDVDLAKGDFPISTLKNDPALTRAVWPVRDVSTGPAKIWRTGQTLCFDEVGDARACAGTGEDGDKLAGTAWPAPRFSKNAGAAFALDRLTGLIWSTATMSPGPAACIETGLIISWQQALNHVACLNANAFLGRTDWRVPNRKELRSLADYSAGAPALPAAHPFTGFDDFLRWSSTTNTTAPGEAWAINFFDGSLFSSSKGSQSFVWPVSGPDLAPPALTITQGSMTTNVLTHAISGTAEAGAAVMVAVNNGAPASAAVTGTNWSFTAGPLASGSNTITVSADDFSENRSTASITITIDTAAPALAIDPATTPARTNKKNHTIAGTMEAGSTVVVKMGAATLPVTVNGTNWSCPVAGLSAGANSITVTATDAVGNVATQTTDLTFAAPDGMVAGGSSISINDALKALRMAVGIITPSADDLLRGDVAPMGAPDDKIDVSDVILILKKAVGMPSF